MAVGAPLLTLLTDFGTADYYVGAFKGTLLRLAPRARLVDLSHEVPPGDVEGAADLLAGAVPAFAAGCCHLAVVDPGVGSARRLLVAQWRDQLLVAPDNGVLTPFLVDGATAWSVTRSDLFLAGPGSTFHGRDRFAPIAAALLRGDHPAALATPIADAVRLGLPSPRRVETPGLIVLEGRVARVDRYGNLVTDLPAAWAAVVPAGGPPVIHARVGVHQAHRWVSHYAALPAGEPGVLVGSRGTLELTLRDASLAAAWGVERGASVRVEIAGYEGAGKGT
jgi:S-adenosyl-L-methionine hydrolase (adenosine-forming)